jgi:hypothetical protein
MKPIGSRGLLMGVVALTAWLAGGAPPELRVGYLFTTAEARFGRPATPVSYAGIARRTTVRAATPGVGAPGVGVAPGVGAGGVGGPASGVGVLPGAGAGQAGVGYSGGAGVNLGGPVNRVGVR